MPTSPTYPGVYIEEIPSGVRTITGVATSITAFVGWAPKGSTDHAELVLSWADYERKFGGLDARSYLGYAVSHFFVNGGQQAYIVRLVTAGNPDATKNATPATIKLGTTMMVSSVNSGAWGNAYGVKLTKRTDKDKADRFRIEVLRQNPDKTETTVESFENMSVVPTDSRYVEAIVNHESALITVALIDKKTQPADVIATQILKDGRDGDVLSPQDAAFNTQLVELVAKEDGLLDRVDLFNILCVPGEADVPTIQSLQAFCQKRRAMLIVDCKDSDKFDGLLNGPIGLAGDASINATFYFPWVTAPDSNQERKPRLFPPCGFIAGQYARTDAQRGVWKAPAGIDASLVGVTGLKEILTDKENGVLNKKGINCLRTFPVYGSVTWGSRTLRGDDEIGSEWKYIPVRRTALFIEESLYRGMKWVVFEPNDEPLWAQIRLNVGAFMHNLFRQGAFQGTTPKDAYFVKCDKETTTQNDINLGIVNIVVGFAPLKPAEFVIIKLQQIAGQIEV